MLFLVPFVRSVLFVALLLNRNPNAIATTVEESCLQQPSTLRVAAQGLGVHVEVPLSAGQSELTSGRRRISRRSVDWCVAVRRI